MGNLEKDIDAEIKRTERSIQEIGVSLVDKAGATREQRGIGLGYYSIKEASVITGLSESTIRRYVRTGVLRSWQPAEKGGRIMIPASELTKYDHT